MSSATLEKDRDSPLHNTIMFLSAGICFIDIFLQGFLNLISALFVAESEICNNTCNTRGIGKIKKFAGLLYYLYSHGIRVAHLIGI